jgi:2-hydroxycyclohexanecarboxyl-CoA dehydrogenase
MHAYKSAAMGLRHRWQAAALEWEDDMQRLTDRAGIIVGGASGIGRAIAARLAAEGAKVAIFDRNGEAARAMATDLAGGGSVAIACEVDVTDKAGIEAAVAHTVEAFGPLWFLVNSAGWDAPGRFLESDPVTWRRIIDINLYGALNLHHTVCRHLKAAGGGRVVSIASDAARTGAGDVAVYSACKAGVIALTKTLARELASAGILLNAVSPGPTDTPLLASFAGSGPDGARWLDSVKRTIPLRRLGTPEDFTGIVAMLLSEEGSYITGQTISVSGGLTMI